MIALTIDLAGKKYIKIQPLDSHNNPIGLPTYISCFNLLDFSPVNGNTIGINKSDPRHLYEIKYADIALYNGVAPPSFSVIYNDLATCLP